MAALNRTRNQKKSMHDRDGHKKGLRHKQSPEKLSVLKSAGSNVSGNWSWPRPSSGSRRMYCRSSSFTLVSDLPEGHTYIDVCNDDDTESYFPFQNLPEICKVHIFSFLNQREKGRLAMVCQEWNFLLRDPSLWTIADMSEISPHCLKHQRMSELIRPYCGTCHGERMNSFINFLIDLKPTLSKLVFNYDALEKEELGVKLLFKLLKFVKCTQLRRVHLNWIGLSDRCMAPYRRSNDLHYAHKRRARLFLNMFEEFVCYAASVTTLVIPFVWYERSVSCITRLKNLEILVLIKYFYFENVAQSHLTQLLWGLPRLRKLMLEVNTSHENYSLHSQTLEYLDLSHCRGFYLRDLYLPALTQLIVSRPPWRGFDRNLDQGNDSCLLNFIESGCLPNLEKLNDCNLVADNSLERQQLLNEALYSVCSCVKHRQDWLG